MLRGTFGTIDLATARFVDAGMSQFHAISVPVIFTQLKAKLAGWPDYPPREEWKTGAIIGGTVGGSAIIGLCCAAVVLIKKRKQARVTYPA